MMVKALTRPAKSIASAITKMSMPSTLLGTTAARRESATRWIGLEMSALIERPLEMIETAARGRHPTSPGDDEPPSDGLRGRIRPRRKPPASSA